MVTNKRLFICLRGNAGDDYQDFYGGKIVVAKDEDEAKELYRSYTDDSTDLEIYPDNEDPLEIIDVTEKLNTSMVLYDNPCR
jgi:hypothetical protein